MPDYYWPLWTPVIGRRTFRRARDTLEAWIGCSHPYESVGKATLSWCTIESGMCAISNQGKGWCGWRWERRVVASSVEYRIEVKIPNLVAPVLGPWQKLPISLSSTIWFFFHGGEDTSHVPTTHDNQYTYINLETTKSLGQSGMGGKLQDHFSP